MTDPTTMSGPDQAFQKHLASGRLMLQRGTTSGAWVYYPRTIAPGSGDDLEWAEPSGLGTVYSTTVARKRPPEPSLNVSLVELDEGPRMMSRVEGIDASEVRIGMRVKARITRCEDHDAPYIVVFDPAESSP